MKPKPQTADAPYLDDGDDNTEEVDFSKPRNTRVNEHDLQNLAADALRNKVRGISGQSAKFAVQLLTTMIRGGEHMPVDPLDKAKIKDFPSPEIREETQAKRAAEERILEGEGTAIGTIGIQRVVSDQWGRILEENDRIEISIHTIHEKGEVFVAIGPEDAPPSGIVRDGRLVGQGKTLDAALDDLSSAFYQNTDYKRVFIDPNLMNAHDSQETSLMDLLFSKV